MRVATIEATKDWYCPNCGLRDTTPSTTPNRQHPCPQLRGLVAPLVPQGIRARVFVREREDYIGREHVQLDPERRRPVMSIVTERADGSNDAIVFAPAARIGR